MTLENLIAHRARTARQAIEELLEALGWPANESALSCCIDRLLQIEEGDCEQ